MADEYSDDHIRVGNPERERAIALLNEAFSGGYLDIAEFEDRSGVVYSAKTRGELRPVLDNLPVAGRLFTDGPVGGAVVAAGAASLPATPPVQFNASWETVRRKGVWEVPSRMLATGSMGTVDLDFVNATFSSPVVELELQVSVATVKIRLGADHEVRYEHLRKTGWSDLKDKSGPPSRPGGPVIHLSGSVSAMSSVKIRRA